MFTLAAPVVLAELGWVAMGLVDILMVGSLGPEAIGAVRIGTSIFLAVCIFGMGTHRNGAAGASGARLTDVSDSRRSPSPKVEAL